MLSVLDRAEIRRLATLGMSLELANAYRMPPDKLIGWIHERQDLLAEVDLEEISKVEPGQMVPFREGVIPYLAQIQRYRKEKSCPAPTWPPTQDTEEAEPEVEEEAVAEEVSFKMSGTETGRLSAKEPNPGNSGEEEVEEKAPPKTGPAEVVEIKVKRSSPKKPAEEKPVVRFRRGGLKKAKAPTTEEPPAEEPPTVEQPPHEIPPTEQPQPSVEKLLFLLYEVEAELGAANNKIGKLEDMLVKIMRTVEHGEKARAAQHRSMSRALLFVINEALLEEGSAGFTTLDNIPE
jgi:hypothetical protein